ncbi:hypothetical protein VTN96DRAFT_1240 [Rasamsonia emersonii]
MEDPVRPSSAEVYEVLARSYTLWSSLKDLAKGDTKLPFDCVQLRSILGPIPAYLADGRSHDAAFSIHRRDNKTGSELYLSGHSMWETPKGTCDLPPRILSHRLLFAVQHPTRCILEEGTAFSSWQGVQGLPDDAVDGNYLAILVLAWAYILSARWLEMQQSTWSLKGTSPICNPVRYLEPRAQWADSLSQNQTDCIDIDLGTVDGSAARWWAAILAPGEGWCASITHDGQVYRSPWSVSVTSSRPLSLRGIINHPDNESSPPSAADALRFLSEFCATYGLYGQCAAALTAALFIPFHNDATATLPLPRPYPRPNANISSQTRGCTLPLSPSLGHVEAEGRLLCYYMTLSCNIWGIRSLLCSTFFDPEIYCNLVSPWLEPAFGVINEITKQGDWQLLVKVMTRRQPSLGPLWLGAILTGAAQSILRVIHSGQMAIELHASAWTSTPQSFITIEPPSPCAIGGFRINRSDECRLLFISGSKEHSRAPVCPWKPFGTTLLSDTETQVRAHAQCKGHYLRYKHWCWDMNGSAASLCDEGFNRCAARPNPVVTKGSSPAIQHAWTLQSHELSEVATRNIFSWLRNTGYPSNEAAIRKHPWLDLEDSECSEDESGSVDSSPDSSKGKSLISRWLQRVD